MASGPLVGGSSGGGAGGGAGGGGREVPRERQRWADKVYTRKIYRRKREPSSQPPQPQPQPPEQQQQPQPESTPEQQRDEPPHQQLHREQHPEPQRQQLEKAHSPGQEQPSQETLALLRLQPSQETLATTANATATTTTTATATATAALDNGGGASPPSPHRPSPARHDDEGRPQEPPAHGSESTASDNAPVGLNSISNYNHRGDVTTDKTRTFGPPPSGAHQSAADQTNGRPRPRPPFVSYKRDSSGKRRLVVNLASRSRQEVKELHGKLTTELGQVRAMLLQVEECEKRLLAAVATPPPPTTHSLVPVEVGYATLPEFSGNGGAPAMSAPPLALPAGVGYTHAAQHPVFPPGNGALTTPIAKRTFTNSEGGGYTAIRPMQRQLSVSVGTGLLDTTSVSNSMGDVMEKEKRTPKANQYYTNSEFLLAKDKFPPSDSHSKKSKSKTDHGARGGSKPYERAFKSCVSLLSRLMKHRHGWVFNKPVDVKGLGLHDYYTIVKCPMDLGTIKSKLNSNFYRDPRDFAEDVRLTFRNAMLYNPKGQDVHVMAEQLLQIFEDRWPMIEAEMTMPMFPTILTKKVPPPPLDMRRILERSASSVRPMWSEQATTPYSFTPQSVRSAAPKKPKAKDPNKRDMTFDEKQKLSKNLQSLPLERVEMVVQIIKRRNSALSQHDGEIEVDIDSVDTETLWELDRFVTNYKKSLSKHKRKAEMALQAKLEAERIAQLRNPAPLAIAELQKDNDTEGKHRLSASPVREENREKDKDDNDSASSSSCSSSSDSGSSSSDSDSDSSSS